MLVVGYVAAAISIQ